MASLLPAKNPGGSVMDKFTRDRAQPTRTSEIQSVLLVGQTLPQRSRNVPANPRPTRWRCRPRGDYLTRSIFSRSKRIAPVTV